MSECTPNLLVMGEVNSCIQEVFKMCTEKQNHVKAIFDKEYDYLSNEEKKNPKPNSGQSFTTTICLDLLKSAENMVNVQNLFRAIENKIQMKKDLENLREQQQQESSRWSEPIPQAQEVMETFVEEEQEEQEDENMQILANQAALMKENNYSDDEN